MIMHWKFKKKLIWFHILCPRKYKWIGKVIKIFVFTLSLKVQSKSIKVINIKMQNYIAELYIKH